MRGHVNDWKNCENDKCTLNGEYARRWMNLSAAEGDRFLVVITVSFQLDKA